ncbi:hypothetical protein GH714_025669 [Hevea brasiliensis]|uniref:Uncharacterized protein n=1 Tax=Hevea brasiliensis TaxID=3981 RepID=A0A6A6LB88_HEVBR|nr:hypothetical protein GH714_025669 [Hevea brasiliensis]
MFVRRFEDGGLEIGWIQDSFINELSMNRKGSSLRKGKKEWKRNLRKVVQAMSYKEKLLLGGGNGVDMVMGESDNDSEGNDGSGDESNGVEWELDVEGVHPFVDFNNNNGSNDSPSIPKNRVVILDDDNQSQE